MSLHDTWVVLEPMLRPAIETSMNRPRVLADVMGGYAQLWAINENGKPVAVVVTRIQTTTEKHCLLWLVGGTRVAEWAPTFIERIMQFARSYDCVALYGAGRKGWARIVKKFGGESIEPLNGSLAWRLVI